MKTRIDCGWPSGNDLLHAGIVTGAIVLTTCLLVSPDLLLSLGGLSWL